MDILVSLLIFCSIYSFIYQAYSQKRARLSLGRFDSSGKGDSSAEGGLPRENVLRGLVKPFIFLGQFKAVRHLVGASIPGRLAMAGFPLSTIEFAIIKVLGMVIFTIGGSIISRGEHFAAYTAGGAAIGFIFPELWLNLRIKRRHNEIRRELPMVIDLLDLCVGAGLDLAMAINRVIKEFKKCALTNELSEVWREIKMGSSRREALQHLARRVNLPELSSFVRTLLQADRIGSPMGEALKIQSEEIRQRRYINGEELALKAPIKLLFPLFVFILPVIFIIVAGPVLMQFVRGGGIKF